MFYDYYRVTYHLKTSEHFHKFGRVARMQSNARFVEYIQRADKATT